MALQHLQALKRFAESDTCRRVPLLAYFGEKYLDPKLRHVRRVFRFFGSAWR